MALARAVAARKEDAQTGALSQGESDTQIGRPTAAAKDHRTAPIDDGWIAPIARRRRAGHIARQCNRHPPAAFVERPGALCSTGEK